MAKRAFGGTGIGLSLLGFGCGALAATQKGLLTAYCAWEVILARRVIAS
jgi:hypothetical protein